MATPQPRVTLLANPTIPFYPAIPTGLIGLGQCSYLQSIRPLQYPNPYQLKVLMSDELCIQIHTQSNNIAAGYNPPMLYLYYYYVDQNNIVTGIPVPGIDLNSRPYYKGVQKISGNTFTNPNDNSVLDLDSSCWGFSFDDLGITDGGLYCLKIVNLPIDFSSTDVEIVYYSEPLLVSNQIFNTQLFSFYYNSNNSRKNVVISGWWNDSGETQPFNPVFNFRFESVILDYDPMAENIAYLAQNYDMVNIQNQKKTIQTLKVGEMCNGIPDYGLWLITEALLADNLTIDGILYQLYMPTGSTTPTLFWKIKRNDANPLKKATAPIIWVSDANYAMISPTLGLGGGVYVGVYSDVYD